MKLLPRCRGLFFPPRAFDCSSVDDRIFGTRTYSQAMIGDRTPPVHHSVPADAVAREGIAVLLVSDVRLFRDGLALVLAETSVIRVVGSAATRVEVERAVADLRPDVLLLDMSIPQCVEIGRAVRAAAPDVAMVAFAATSSEAEQIACVEVGITGFVPRDGGIQDLIDAVMSVNRGEAFCSPQVVASTFRRLAALAATGRVPETTTRAVSLRERQIIELIDRGLSNKEIAQRLQIGIATVKNHVHNILEKLEVGRRGEVAARLRERSRAVSGLPIRGDASSEAAAP